MSFVHLLQAALMDYTDRALQHGIDAHGFILEPENEETISRESQASKRNRLEELLSRHAERIALRMVEPRLEFRRRNGGELLKVGRLGTFDF